MKPAEALESQVNRLAKFILNECDGYPNQSEGAIDCAIRIIKDLKAQKASQSQPSDEDIEKWANDDIADHWKHGGGVEYDLIYNARIRGAKALRDGKISTKD